MSQRLMNKYAQKIVSEELWTVGFAAADWQRDKESQQLTDENKNGYKRKTKTTR